MAASSSEAEAFCWVAWLSWTIAPLIWPTPVDCSEDAAAISWTRSEVLRMLGTIAVSSVPACSACLTDESARSPISLAATCERSASLRTSAATTAKPLPCSPARAASMAALSASRIGLVGDVVDDADAAGDALHVVDGAGDRVAALGGFAGGLGGHRVGDLGVVGVLGDRSGHLLHRRGGFLDRSGLFGRRLRERLGGRRDLAGGVGEVVGGAAHLADDLREAGDHIVHGAHQQADLIAAVGFELDREVAFGEPRRGAERLVDRPRDGARDEPGEEHGDQHRRGR